jgi:plasmid stabilization system protein ParE
MNIIWGDQALEDLDAIYQGLATANKKAAIKLYNEIIDKAEMLLSFPTMAPILILKKDMEFPPRGLLTNNKFYKIIYFVDIEYSNIYISQIWDCRRNPANLRL